jgi:hypothetical protein
MFPMQEPPSLRGADVDRTQSTTRRAEDRPSVHRAVLAGVGAILPWSLLEAGLSSPVTATGLLLALLVGVGFGTALGLAAGRIRDRRATAALVLLPLPFLYGPTLAASLERIVHLHFYLVAPAVWISSLAAGAIAGTALFLLMRWRARGLPLARWSVGLGGGVLITAVALPPLQGVCVAAAVGLALLVCFGGLGVLVFAGRFQAALAATLGAVAVAGLSLLPDRYLELQAILGGAAIGGTFLSLGAGLRCFGYRGPRRAAITYVLLAAAAVGGAHLLVVGSPEAWAARKGPGGVTSFLVRAGRRVGDFDGDRHGVLFGLIDCGPWDAQVHPAAHERPGNGIDDNCLAGDATGHPLAWIRAQEAVNPAPPPWRGDIVLVTVDCLRHASTEALDLPALRAMEREGVTFERAYASSSFTPMSFMGLLSSRLPSNIPLVYATRFAGTPERPIGGIAPRLREAGYETALAGGIPADISDYFTTENFGAGFQSLRLTPYTTPAREVTAEALRLWASMGTARPRFLWIHYFSVHNTQNDLERYEAAIAAFDGALAALREGLGPDPLVILTADHGEEFGEHGKLGHASSLYEEVVRIPLIIAGGDLPGGRRVDAVSPIRALMPTLLAMLAPALAPPGPGPYLCLGPGECRDQPVPMGLWLPAVHLHGLVLGERKVIRDLTPGAPRGLRSRLGSRRTVPPRSHPGGSRRCAGCVGGARILGGGR